MCQACKYSLYDRTTSAHAVTCNVRGGQDDAEDDDAEAAYRKACAEMTADDPTDSTICD